jgi:Protein of unknown function (DUF1549)/Protein of unknown function (DUF1553)
MNRCTALAVTFSFFAVASTVEAQSLKPANTKKPAANKPSANRKAAAPSKPVAPPAPRSSLLTAEAWQKAPLSPIERGEIDRLVARELQRDHIEPAPLTTDEQFVRRVMLDLTGQLPVPADVTEFVADRDPNKRANLIDKLLDSDEYARHWARYWREVIVARVNDRRGQALGRAFEEWMTKQLKENRGWGAIVRDMLTAEGGLRFDDDGEKGALFFLASRFGADSANEQAAETARLFLGIQIQCAQCHDHPTDQWKRVQFHELAAYFARETPRPMREPGRPMLVGLELVPRPREHEMPSKEDPKKTFVTHPRFLDGKSPGVNLSDRERRRALANAVTDKNNYWFAGAYVNRIWGELMGQSFYQPVDDMGPGKEAVFPGVLTRLTGAFRGSNYDVKAMFRAVLNSQTYQRQIRLGEASDQHLHFAAAYPTRLHADALWDSLVGVLGALGGPIPPRPVGPNPLNFRPGLEGQFKDEFSFDPSLKADEVEGSVSQALLMMNNPVVNGRIQARGTNLLARILTAYPNDDDALRMVYLRTLARKPTDREIDRCRQYLREAGSRAEAFEDILWALLNSTEFQTKR